MSNPQRSCYRLLSIVLTVLLLTALSERPAYAYADPGSGALMWQALMAAVAGAAFYFRRFLSRFTDRQRKSRK